MELATHKQRLNLVASCELGENIIVCVIIYSVKQQDFDVFSIKIMDIFLRSTRNISDCIHKIPVNKARKWKRLNSTHCQVNGWDVLKLLTQVSVIFLREYSANGSTEVSVMVSPWPGWTLSPTLTGQYSSHFFWKIHHKDYMYEYLNTQIPYFSLKGSCQHDNCWQFLLPNHSPKVSHSIWHGTL